MSKGASSHANVSSNTPRSHAKRSVGGSDIIGGGRPSSLPLVRPKYP
jgi:hypothetical protein